MLAYFFLSACENQSSSGDDMIEMKISTSVPDDGTDTKAVKIFKRELERKLGEDKVDIKIYPNSQLGDYEHTLKQVRNKQLAAVYEGMGTISSWTDLANIESIPYLFEDDDEFERVWNSREGEKFLNELAKESGFRMTKPAYRGKRQITSDKPIKDIDDLKGLKIRVPDVRMYKNVFEIFGANPTPISFDEMYTAIQQQVVDGQENPMAVIRDKKIYEVNDYINLTNHITEPMGLIMNDEWYQGLNNDVREAVDEAGKKSSIWYTEYIKDKEEEILLELKEDYGMKIVETDLSEFKRKAKDLKLSDELESWKKKFKNVD